MDQKSPRGLSRKIANRDCVPVDEKLERLHDDVADEERAQHLAGRVPGHPVDDTETDESGPDIAGQDLGFIRNGQS